MGFELNREEDRAAVNDALRAIETPREVAFDLSGGEFPISPEDAGRGATFKVTTGGEVAGKVYHPGDLLVSNGAEYIMILLNQVTKGRLGLDQVDNTPDLDKPISSQAQDELDNKTTLDEVTQSNLAFTGDSVQIYTYHINFTESLSLNIAGDIRFQIAGVVPTRNYSAAEAIAASSGADLTLLLPHTDDVFLAVTDDPEGNPPLSELPSGVVITSESNVLSEANSFQDEVRGHNLDRFDSTSLVRVDQMSSFPDGANFPYSVRGSVETYFEGPSLSDKFLCHLIDGATDDFVKVSPHESPLSDFIPPISTYAMTAEGENSIARLLPRWCDRNQVFGVGVIYRTIIKLPEQDAGDWMVFFGITRNDQASLSQHARGYEGFGISRNGGSKDFELRWVVRTGGFVSATSGFANATDADIDLYQASPGEWLALEIIGGPAAGGNQVWRPTSLAVRAWTLSGIASPVSNAAEVGNIAATPQRTGPIGGGTGPVLHILTLDSTAVTLHTSFYQVIA